jgi:hypothetical protein
MSSWRGFAAANGGPLRQWACRRPRFARDPAAEPGRGPGPSPGQGRPLPRRRQAGPPAGAGGPGLPGDAGQAALDRAIAAQAPRADKPVVGKSRYREPKRNITEPESRAMQLRGGGWIQGYNCRAVTSSDGMVIATGVGSNLNDATAFTTTLDRAVAAATLIDAHRPATARSTSIGVLLADAGYLSANNLSSPGPDRLIAVGEQRHIAAAAREHPTEVRRRRTPPPSTDGAPATNPNGHARYKQRSHIAEMPFAHAKHNFGLRRFTSRVIARAATEFSSTPWYTTYSKPSEPVASPQHHANPGQPSHQQTHMPDSHPHQFRNIPVVAHSRATAHIPDHMSAPNDPALTTWCAIRRPVSVTHSTANGVT